MEKHVSHIPIYFLKGLWSFEMFSSHQEAKEYLLILQQEGCYEKSTSWKDFSAHGCNITNKVFDQALFIISGTEFEDILRQFFCVFLSGFKSNFNYFSRKFNGFAPKLIFQSSFCFQTSQNKLNFDKQQNS